MVVDGHARVGPKHFGEDSHVFDVHRRGKRIKRHVLVGAEHHEESAARTDGGAQGIDDGSGASLDRTDSPHAGVDHHDVASANAKRAKLFRELNR